MGFKTMRVRHVDGGRLKESSAKNSILLGGSVVIRVSSLAVILGDSINSA